MARPARRRGPPPSPRIQASPEAPLALAVDTSSAVEALALVQGDVVLAAQRIRRPTHRGAALADTIASLLEQVGRGPGDLRAAAVAVGPGAFTGLRVGIATVQGLATGLGIPAWGFSSLPGWAEAAGAPDSPVGVTLDARRGEVYTALYGAVGPDGARAELDPPRVQPPEAWFAALARRGERVVLVGDGARLHREAARAAFGAELVLRDALPAGPDVCRAAVTALERLAAGEPGPPAALQPVYLREHDGKRTG